MAESTIAAPVYEEVETVHCPTCHQLLEVHRRTAEGTYSARCTCGARVGMLMTLFGDGRHGAGH